MPLSDRVDVLVNNAASFYAGGPTFDAASLFRPATTAWPVARAALAKSVPVLRPASVMNQIFLALGRILRTLLEE